MSDEGVDPRDAGAEPDFVRVSYSVRTRPHLVRASLEEIVLVISPHPDDAELAMGATMFQAAQEGARVVHLILVCGQYTNAEGVWVNSEDRVNEAVRAAEVLGVSDLLVFEGVPENHGLEYIDQMTTEIDHWLKVLDPVSVYTCLPWFNPDHDAVYKATLAAMRRHFEAAFWAYEMPQQNLGYQMPEHGWAYVSLEDGVLEKKIAALEEYRTQDLWAKYGPVSIEGVCALACLRGIEVGVRYAERVLLLRG